MLRQWFFRITAFQDSLLQGIDSLLQKGSWPERVLVQQKHWLGKSEGAKIKFLLSGESITETTVTVFSTRPDTLFGVQYLALSCGHPIVRQLAETNPELKAFVKEASNLPPETKAGFRLPGIYATNPLEKSHPGQTAKTPVFAAPYVLGDYGEGAVMGVPGHDTRDWAFWAEHGAGQSPKVVVRPVKAVTPNNDAIKLPLVAYTQLGVLNDSCGSFAGLDSVEAGKRITASLHEGGDGESAENWRLRDWLVSRQRYWGTPIPIIHCRSCGTVPVPDEQLPVELPDLADAPVGITGNPLEHIESWVNTLCPSCDAPARRDTDTMDTFVDSSWYYMRFPDPGNKDALFSPTSAKEKLPVDIYVGGVEHAILHLLYARFIYKFLVSEGLIPKQSESDEGSIEPFVQVISQGMVHGKTFSDPATGRFLHPAEVEFTSNGAPIIKATGMKPNISFEKMSKSKHNGVDPSDCIAKYGADATRAHMLFSAPVSEILEWDEEKIVGIQRWFGRITKIVNECSNTQQQNLSESPFDLTNTSHLTDQDTTVLLLTNQTIKSVTRTFESNIYALNTTISDLIKLTNQLSTYTHLSDPSSTKLKYQTLLILLRLLHPIAPTFTQQAWSQLHSSSSSASLPTTTTTTMDTNADISQTPFPTPILTPSQESSLLSRRTTFTCTVQVNGKVRFSVEIPSPYSSSTEEHDIGGKEKKGGNQRPDEEYLIEKLLETEEGRKWLTVKNEWGMRKRVVVIKGGRMVNFVF